MREESGPTASVTIHDYADEHETLKNEVGGDRSPRTAVMIVTGTMC